MKNNKITEAGVAAINDFYQTISVEQIQLPGIRAFVTGVDSSSLNVVLDTRKNTEQLTSEIISSVTNFFKNHQVPWSWFFPASAPGKEIEKYGFNLTYETAAMYFDLSRLLPATKTDSDVVIKEENNDLHEWIEPIAEGFPNSDNGEAYRRLNANLLSSGEEKLRHFTAYYRGEAAASATLFLSENGATMLHNLATKNRFRKLGIGSSLTLHLMSEAKKSGYKYCFLDSSDAAFNLYQRLGFKTYCVTSEYEIVTNNSA